MKNAYAPDEFMQEMAARLALHEVLLEQVFSHLLAGHPEAVQQWKLTGDAIVKVMGSLHQPQDLAGLEDWQVHWMENQRSLGQEMAQRFVDKVALHLS